MSKLSKKIGFLLGKDKAKKVKEDKKLELTGNFLRNWEELIIQLREESEDVIKAICIAILKGEEGRDEATNLGGPTLPETIAFNVTLGLVDVIKTMLFQYLISLLQGKEAPPLMRDILNELLKLIFSQDKDVFIEN